MFTVPPVTTPPSSNAAGLQLGRGHSAGTAAALALRPAARRDSSGPSTYGPRSPALRPPGSPRGRPAHGPWQVWAPPLTSFLFLAHRWSRPGCSKPKLLHSSLLTAPLHPAAPRIPTLPAGSRLPPPVQPVVLRPPHPKHPACARGTNVRGGVRGGGGPPEPPARSRPLTPQRRPGQAALPQPGCGNACAPSGPSAAGRFLPPPSPLPLPFLKASVPTSTHQVLVSPRGRQSPWRPRIFRGSVRVHSCS